MRGRSDKGDDLFHSRDVVEILGISRRQLQYWSQTDLVVPSAHTPGGHSRYTFGDLVALKADSGRLLWQDTLASVSRTDVVSNLAHIRGRPGIDREIV